MQKTNEDFVNEYYTSYFEGNPITFIKNKFTNDIRVNANDVLVALGYEGTFKEFLGTDQGLDLINEWKRTHPNIPFFGGAITEIDTDL